MSLALVLRNISRAQVGSIHQNLLKNTICINKEFHTLLPKRNVNHRAVKLITPVSNVLRTAPARLMSADHSKLWTLEKALSLGLLGIVPAAIAAPNFIFDNLLAVASVIHFHWGLEAVVVDYARPIVVGTVISKLCLGLLYLVSAATLGALIYYNVNDIGIGKTIRRFWAIKSGGNTE